MSSGFLSWAESPFFDAGGHLPGVWFDGRFFEAWLEEDAGGISWRDDDGVIVLGTHAATHIVQVRYRGSKAPLVGDRKEFTTGLLGIDLDDWRRVEIAKSLGRPVLFCPGIWAADSYPIVSGLTYTLTRPLAAGLVPGISEATHPTYMELDGEASPTAATIAGQTITAAATGELSVLYMPVYRVVVLGLERSVQEPNRMVISATFSETVAGDFE